jgi:murein L,D-transpeptidase YcbB/YkuD
VALSATLGVVGGVVSGHLLGGAPAGPDPLGLGVSMVNQQCTGQSLLVTAWGATDTSLTSAVAENPDHTHYLRIASSCNTAWRQNGLAAVGYAAYLGPYGSVGQACEQRMTVAHRGDMVTRLQAGNTQPVQCLCYLDYTTFPTLRQGMTVTARIGIYVRAMQKLLVTAKLSPPEAVTGLYDAATMQRIEAFQAAKGLPQNGYVDGPTWHQLLGPGCAA